MRLVVAEKPSVARDLARVLGARTKQNGALVGDGWVVTWCIGHLVELEEPDAYDPKWKRWSLGTLPMIPAAFRLRPAKKTMDQWRVVRDLLRRRDFVSVVNACDAGREGELIFRYAHERAKSRLPIERLWISSLTPEAIRAGFRKLESGRSYEGLAAAARCRSQADWLVGLNATRAMTLVNDGGVYSIGRVQTPTLALVVAREQEIRTFEPERFWELTAKADTGILAKWRAPAGPSRLAAEGLASNLRARVEVALPLVVTHVDEKTLRERPPQLFDLTSLQRLANTRFGYSAKRTLQLLQGLYEKHKAITYPRTSSRYLASDQRATLPDLVDAFSEHPSYGRHAAFLQRGPLPITRRVVDDAKVTEHHAIIPTGRQPKLSGEEAKVYDLVVRRFLAAFHPDAELHSTEVVLATGPTKAKPKRWTETILKALPGAPDHFITRGRVTVEPGWHAVEPPRASREPSLPAMKVGERVAVALRVTEGRTKPPPRYSDASLLGAMETAGKRVEDETLREALKACGLGTPATRAAIIETLIRRDYVKRDKKTLVAQDKGIALIDALADPTLRSAELTGAWEARLQAMADGSEAPEAFMADVCKLVAETVDTLTAKPTTPGRAPERAPVGHCPRCRADVTERRSGFECSACHFSVPRRLAGRELSAGEVRDLLRSGRTGTLAGFRSKKKRRFRAALRIEDGEVRFVFPGKGKAPPAPARARPADGLGELTCPACQRPGMVAGRRAWGCAHWRDGCSFRVPYVVDQKKLSPAELRALLTKGKTRKATFGSGKGRVHLVDLEPTLVLDPG